MIEEDSQDIGAYLYVYDGARCVRDDLQDDVATCKQVAFEKYGVSLAQWKNAADGEDGNGVRNVFSTTGKKAFLFGIASYIIAWVGILVFGFRVFGIGAAIGLSLFLIFPFVVAVRMYHRWPTVRRTEFALLLVLLFSVFGGSAFTVWRWYDSCMDLQHARDLRFDELAQEAHAVPAFRGVEFSSTNYKGRYVIRGTVATQADLERFLALCDRYDFRFYAKGVTAVSGNKRKSE
jgi:hypothetical protein